MEAFGRVIAVILAVTGLCFTGIFLKSGQLQRQKSVTARSVTKEFVSKVLENGCVSGEEKEQYEAQMAALGTYRIEITVYERCRLEDENGRIYTYQEELLASEGTQLLPGSYLRIQVTEQESNSAERFMCGPGAVIIAGGRVF